MSTSYEAVVSAVVTPYGKATVENATKLRDALVKAGLADDCGGVDYGGMFPISYFIKEHNEPYSLRIGDPVVGQIVFYFAPVEEDQLDVNWTKAVITVNKFKSKVYQMLQDVGGDHCVELKLGVTSF
jgi:hypothetical protein